MKDGLRRKERAPSGAAGSHVLLCVLCVSAVIFLSTIRAAHAEPRWLTLPATPTLPRAADSGLAPVNGIKIWYAAFGHGAPVILLHGGLANSNYWGNQVAPLAKFRRVIVMDSRGHGRSSRDDRPFGYDLMAEDVVALMDHLQLKKAAIVGWSDGAIIGLMLALRHPDRTERVFAFAANSDPSAVMDLDQSVVFTKFIARAESEYRVLSPTPDGYKSFLDQISKMWATQPNFTAEDLAKISVPVWIADGDHEEAIKRANTEFMAQAIPGAGLLILPGVSHFAHLQNSSGFTANIINFLRR